MILNSLRFFSFRTTPGMWVNLFSDKQSEDNFWQHSRVLGSSNRLLDSTDSFSRFISPTTDDISLDKPMWSMHNLVRLGIFQNYHGNKKLIIFMLCSGYMKLTSN